MNRLFASDQRISALASAFPLIQLIDLFHHFIRRVTTTAVTTAAVTTTISNVATAAAATAIADDAAASAMPFVFFPASFFLSCHWRQQRPKKRHSRPPPGAKFAADAGAGGVLTRPKDASSSHPDKDDHDAFPSKNKDASLRRRESRRSAASKRRKGVFVPRLGVSEIRRRR